MSVSIFRYIPLSVHGGIETLAAPAIMAAPVLLGLGEAALVAGFALGATLLGLSLSLFSERRVVPLTAHAGFDYVSRPRRWSARPWASGSAPGTSRQQSFWSGLASPSWR